jgi:hypothetical protein
MANERDIDRDPDLLDEREDRESPRERVGGGSREEIRGIADDKDEDFDDADEMEDDEEEADEEDV